ncbi:hypothetical protein [Leptospira levettii]|uniref:SPOR domain-containing protein n=1 Tax=Leptospira levettii TaxID=2023178 RepID=A0AAW5V7C3_9LEPT|nr:hypothetical protein [Leptospira levettii]MCW7465629.1 hypothetical protein [Leptospira levettii]MCW7510368.1 hypothetical protein [Leptospira levettii]MCW7514120.1 hypothetical protein [Leptospira levettii]TGL74358.1 hypothetical protein EHQ60_03245 [Leptospira levettii]
MKSENNKSFNRFQNVLFFSFICFTYSSLLLCDPIIAKEPPNQITFTEGGVQKTFYRNSNLEAEFIEPSQVNSSQNKGLGNGKIKGGWNLRQVGKPLLSQQQNKSNIPAKVTEVYNTGAGYGPNIVLPGIIIVTFKNDQTNDTLSKLAQKYKIVILQQFTPRIVSFQTEPGYLSVEIANELLNEGIVSEAYPETAVEKVLK